MSRTLKAFLGLGSNVGDRLENLRDACEALERRGVAVTDRSAVYETEAQAGAVGQRDFLNACIAVETDLDAKELLAACKEVEWELGRDPKAERHAPRPIDVDVLLVPGDAIDEPGYQVPHAELMERRFVLEPLLELDPPDTESLARALDRVSDQRVTYFGTL